LKRDKFVLTLQPLHGVDAIRSLRWVPKRLLRQFGMGCVDIRKEYSVVLNFNRKILSAEPINELINQLIDAAEPPGENYRQYLGASAIGSDCLRKTQYDWFCDPQFPGRIKDIFARGHFFEEVTRQHLIKAGFKFAPAERLEFLAADGLFRGHADGIIIDGPVVPGLLYPCCWEHKCLKDKGWKAIERDGLTGLYKTYAAQVACYQAYLDVTNPAVFSVVNADTCDRLHFLVPFDAQLAQMMSDRAVTIIEATRAGELLDRIASTPDDWRCKMCSWQKRCWRLP
jgi:hypothetical protein